MRQYLDPLIEKEFGEMLEETRREFLTNGQKILETSKRLGITPHPALPPRPVREADGREPRSPRAVVEVWWALECRRWSAVPPQG